MTTVASALEYGSPAEVSCSELLLLEEGAEQVRVVAPVFAKWVYFLPMWMGVLVALLEMWMGVPVFLDFWKMALPAATTFPSVAMPMPFMMDVALGIGVGVAFWIAFVAYHWWAYCRWGRVSRVLTVSGGRVGLAYLGVWSVRCRAWPASDFTKVVLRTFRWKLNPRQTVAELQLFRLKGRRLQFRLSSADAELPRRIAMRVAERLGCAGP